VWKRARAYVELMKPLSSSKSTLYYGFCSFIGSLLASSWSIPVWGSLTVALAMTLSAFATYTLNDICDVKIDAINASERPLPSGRVTTIEAKSLTVVLFAASLLVAYFVNLSAFIFTLLFSILGIAYSVPPLRFKDGLLANICWGLGIATTILGGASVTAINNSSIFAAFTLAFLTAGCGFTKDLKDIKGDKALKVHTLPLQLGEKKAIQVMTLMSITGFPLLFSNVIFTRVNVAYLITISLTITIFAYSLSVLYRNPGSRTSYIKAYKIQAAAGFLIIIAFMTNALV
jgi:4-hydroxybenzoate polyprenyltransferase